ncbi:MAG: hypothetical protein AAF485_00400 [Chloroflexota bacterium]
MAAIPETNSIPLAPREDATIPTVQTPPSENTTENTNTINPLLVLAILGSLIFHGSLSLFGTYQNTYDAFVHIFFADHWTRGWFDHWEPRWYTGFPLISYPPLSQQSIALVSFVTGDLLTSFGIVQTYSITIMAFGMYRFAKLWVSEEAAGWAAIWLVFSSAMAETIHVFGQLPTTYSLGLLLHSLPFAHNWVRFGRKRDLLKAWAIGAATTGAHHVTTLFGAVFIIAPVIVLALASSFRFRLEDEPTARPKLVTADNWRALIYRRVRRLAGPVLRAGLHATGTVTLLITVVFPYWYWSITDPINQVAIPHSSRDNFLVNTSAGLVFWLIPYGVLLVALPYVFYKGMSTKAWPLTGSIGILAFLGTGGTTPFPKMLLGHAFDVLTLDRFTLWASVLALPLAGEFIVSLRHGGLARWLREQFGGMTLNIVRVVFPLSLVFFSIYVVSLTKFRTFQPDPIDVQPIVNFILKDEHWKWRYMTLGFGDQMAWLSAQTTATQVDGNYHAARRLPELNSTPVERLEGAKFRGIPGIGSLQQFLAVPDKYNLKYIYSNDQFYDPLLYFYGWHKLQRLENGIMIWERENIPTLPEVLPRKEIPLYQRWMFGILPVGALVTSFIFVTSPYWFIPVRFLAEFLGITAVLRRLPVRSEQAWPVRMWHKFDHRLLELSQLPAGNEQISYASWQVWLRYFTRFSLKQMKPATVKAHQVRGVLLLLLLGSGLAWGIYTFLQDRYDPLDTIYNYYDDLDFRRFPEAYEALNPAVRPTFDQYMLRLSVKSGLVASYGKLDGLKMEPVIEEPTYMEVDVSARYITSVAYYTDTVRLKLTRPDGREWYIEPDPVELTIPPDEFIRQKGIQWFSQGKRRISEDPVDSFSDVLDLPHIQIMNAQLVQDVEEGRFSIVGEIFNNTADPSDVTVKGILYDTEGEMLVEYNATTAMMHKLFPQEFSPFRIDFEGVAGLTLDDVFVETLDFEPNEFWYYRLPNDKRLSSFVVTAKGAVTQKDLYREVGAQNISLTEDTAGNLIFQAQLINHGLIEATIPHIIVTLFDEAGQVVWVEEHFVREGLRSQRTLDVQFPIKTIDQIDYLPVGGYWYPEAQDIVPHLTGIRPDFIELPPGLDYRYMRVSVNYFAGGVE